MSTHVLDELEYLANNGQEQTLFRGSFEGAGNATVSVNESAFHEKFLLEDMDTYLDDLNFRLTVSRMVNNTVIRGMVNAVVQDADEKIALKDAEIERLKERLQSCESAAGSSYHHTSSQSGSMSRKQATHAHLTHLNLHMEWLGSDHWSSLNLVSKDHLQRLKNEIKCLRNLNPADNQVCSLFDQCKVPENLRKMDESINSIEVILDSIFELASNTHFLLMDTINEQQWRQDFEKQVDTIAVQNFVQSVQEVFHSRFCIEKCFREKWSQAIGDISDMRDELFALSNSLFDLEAGHLYHNSYEKVDERNSYNRKDNGAHKVLSNHTIPHLDQETNSNGTSETKKSDPEVELALLSHMTKEELVSHYKIEMTKMKRHHELALHEKTEEIFRLKREILREKGSSPFRKDKDYELLRKRIMEFISKLNVIVQDISKNIHVQDELKESCILQDHVNSLLMENLHLKGLLSDKRKEVKKLSSQVSNAESQITRQSTVEMKFLHQIKKLKWDFEDVRIEANLRDEISKLVFRNCASEADCQLEASIMEKAVLAEIYSTILGGSISDVETVLNTLMMRHNEEKDLLISEISRKDKILELEMQRVDRLKYDLDLQIRSREEKEILAQELQVRLQQHEQHSHKTSEEISLLMQQIDEQNRLVAVHAKEVNVLKERFNDANDRVHQYEIEVKELNRNLEIALLNCEEAERQNNILHESIQKERDQMASFIADRELEKNEMNTLRASTLDLSKAFVEFERKVTELIELNSSRLLELKCQWEPMTQLVDTLRNQILWYRQNLETKSSNLQKAENEVDLLGDEVDTLLGVLAKMYIALDHYSPVLQHYPGVMEILKLVRRELEAAVKPV